MKATDTENKSEQLQGNMILVRTVESHLRVKVPDTEELKFRVSLLACAIAKLGELKPQMVVRLYEAACAVEFPEKTVVEFRHALQRAIGTTLNLRAYRPQEGKI